MKPTTLFAAIAAFFATAATAQTVSISSANTSPTTIGAVVAGQSYTLTTTGISDLFAAFNGGAGLTFDADGRPTYAFPAPYTGFNPDGSNTAGPGSNCIGEPTLLCGALIGGFTTQAGGTPSSYIQLGSSYSFVAAADGFLVGLVNDVPGAYGDNGPEAFTATLALVGVGGGVPEPATWALMIMGFGAVGGALRRRAGTRTVSFA